MSNRSKHLWILFLLLFAVVVTVVVVSITNDEEADTTTTTQAVGDRIPVTFLYKMDGDTAVFKVNGTEETIRFLCIDTPETVKENTPVEPFGPEASAYTEEALKNATEVQIEYDGPEEDRYDRELAWIWVDGKLLNEELVRQGLAKVAFLFEDTYKYLDELYDAQDQAKAEKIGIWSLESEDAA